ncbi:MAG: orotidine 5'-phosphate decarboxylase [Desulfomonile tiedjei]|nr:orotidine 5'-phosphate decarboxylase [Desulfomonile tiedjei]
MRNYAVILSADLPTSEEVVSAVKEVGKIVDGVKIAEATLLESGKEILQRIRDLIEDKPLLVDLKVADIGFLANGTWQGTNSKIIKCLENSGATHVTVHGFPGPTSVAEAVDTAKTAGLGVLLLPLMSHAGARLFFSRPVNRSDVVYASLKAEMNLQFPDEPSCTDVTEGILLLGEALGADGYIGPATRPVDLQRYRALTQRPIWCPGFGRQDRMGRTLEEQFREWAQIVGPSSAAIVGSTIFAASDRVAAARNVAELRDKAVQ